MEGTKVKLKQDKKKSRGITLIALVVTIIVLLILAGISITTLRGNNGIIKEAKSAKESSEIGSLKEQVQLAIVQAEQKHMNPSLDDVIGEIKDNGIISNEEQVNKENGDITTDAGYLLEGLLNDYLVPPPGKPDANGYFTENSTVDGGEASDENPTIPAGFKPINPKDDGTVGEADWGDGTKPPTDQALKSGLVIQGKDGSEFVWIPVDENLRAGGVEGKEMAELAESNGENYRGILYEFEGTKSSKIDYDSDGYREPDIVSLYDNDDDEYLKEIDSSLTADRFKNEMQDNYNTMIEKVKEYGGFYVGRYETSYEDGKVQSKSGKTSMTPADSFQMWYGMYDKQKKYASNNEIDSVVGSSMIWGSQYDAMMNWMQGNGVDVTSEPQNGSYNNTLTTGKVNTDKIKNVYDLLGCHNEWTLEAYDFYGRVLRGGYYGNGLSPSYRGDGLEPYETDSYDSSRLALYIL